MGNLIRKNWKGWTPNNDENGDPSGLLRADNLVLDEIGSIRLARGTSRKSSGAFGTTSADFINALYSRTLSAATVGVSGSYIKLRYASYNGNVVRNYSGGTPSELDFSGALLTGGAADYAAFGNAWGHTFVFSETKKRADKGPDSSWRDLGIPAPTAPTVEVQPPPTNDIDTVGNFSAYGPWILGTGLNTGTSWERIEGETQSPLTDAYDTTYYQLTTNEETLRGIAQVPATGATPIAIWDSTEFDTVSRRETPNDLFNIEVRFEDTSILKKFRVELYMDDISTSVADAKNYFWHEWTSDQAIDNTADYFDPDVYAFTDSIQFIQQVQSDLIPGVSLSTFFREGEAFWATLQARRGKFKRVGTDDSLDWHTIKGIRIITQYKESLFNGTPPDFYFGDISFIGGTQGQLNGYYSYVEVDINDTGEYTEIGLASAASAEVQVINANVKVTCHALPGNANKKWIFRASTQTPGYYFVKELTSNFTTFFIDTLSDIDALRNQSLEYYRTALPNGIRYVLGPYYDRMIYFDFRTVYPSFRYDPGSYDSRHSFDIAAADNEVILWVQKVIDGEILVGTTNDIYALRGNFSFDETTGLLDVSVQALGIEQVPVSQAVTVYGTTVIYQAEDGWRTIEGSSTKLLTGVLDLLYKKEDRHGIYQVIKGSRSSSQSYVTVSGSRLICSLDHATMGRALHILNLETGQWRLWQDRVTSGDNPQVIITEEDGTVIFSTTSAGDRYLYEWDTGTTIGDARLQQYTFRTTYDDNQQPNNRKDLLVLRVKADTGNIATTITLNGYNHTNTLETKSYTLQCNGLKEVFIDTSNFAIAPKRIQFEFTGTVNTFKLVEFELVYQERPEQVNFLRLPPSHLGVAGRKRLPALNYVIDTLGNTITFTPILDGVVQTTSNVITTDKTVATHFFTADTTGTNVEGLLYGNGSLFEFYELLPSREVEILPDPLEYKFTNYVNFNTTKRKRFSQIARVVDTRGIDVVMTPYMDGVAQLPLTINTNRKQTVIYYWTTEKIGIEIATELRGTAPFEDYGLSLEDCVYEVLPVATRYVRIPSNNFGSPNKKRVRTWPLVIDTKGHDVTFTPNVDRSNTASSTFNTSEKSTVFHYFATDEFGVDYGGQLSGAFEFEFYGALNPVNVEMLPVGKVFDQLGPFYFSRMTKVRVIAMRVLPTGGLITFDIYSNDNLLYSVNKSVIANKEQAIELTLPKGVNGELLRVEMSSGSVFYRINTDLKIDPTGSSTELKRVKV